MYSGLLAKTIVKCEEPDKTSVRDNPKMIHFQDMGYVYRLDKGNTK